MRAGVERVAPTGSRVLITGPAGSGKEVVARMIHARSRRADGPFVVMNCATLNPARFEEELFGLEAGSDPIAHPRRAGVLERAHGGTLLLDEVSDMPLETQGKIVRALQDQTFERLGGSARVKVDVRVLSTTNRDLQTEIGAGRFREDLYYRLAVVPVQVPALKERREDVPPWRNIFIERSAESSGMPVRELSADTLAALQAYDWPGNVRQLRNLMDWLLIMAPGGAVDPIRADMLPPEIGVARAGAAEHRPDRRHHVAAAARGAGSVRNAVSAGAVAAFRRQHFPHRAVRRDGAQRAAPQAEAAWGEFGREGGGLGAAEIHRGSRTLIPHQIRRSTRHEFESSSTGTTRAPSRGGRYPAHRPRTPPARQCRFLVAAALPTAVRSRGRSPCRTLGWLPARRAAGCC